MPEFVFAEFYPGLKLIDTFRIILNTGEMYKLVNNLVIIIMENIIKENFEHMHNTAF